MNLRISILILVFMGIQQSALCYDIFHSNVSYSYKIEAVVELVPDVQTKYADSITQWSMNGSLKINRVDENFVAIQLQINGAESEMALPFKLLSPIRTSDSPPFQFHPMKFLEFNQKEPVWSSNIKRAVASLLQVEGNSESGAYVSQEFGLYGVCPMEYYVNFADDLLISKIYDTDLCTFPGGIFTIRSNIPINFCEPDNEARAHAVMSRLGDYKLSKLNNSQYLLKSIRAESKSNVQSSESYYPQFIFSKIFIDFDSREELNDENLIKFDANDKVFRSDFTYTLSSEATGGRAPKSYEEIASTVEKLLRKLAENLEHKQLKFDEPYVDLVSEIIRLMETMNLQSLQQLYNQIDIGTSYIQETSRNIFLEILPRVGTVSSVLLAKNLVIEKHVRPTTAIQILTALPFFISELSSELIRECEVFLHVGVDRPDVKHSAVLSYSTMIYKAYSAHVITSDQFEKYVKTIFDLLLNSFDYEMQMLYLEAMGNLQLGNVHNYLYPIIKANYSQTTDFRFLAIFATMPTAHKRTTEVYETYWPIFHSKSNPLQLRIAAFNMLFVSAKTPGRLLGIFNVIKNENCPHMLNFYRTTILGISESTYSCLTHLKRLVLYMIRHLPPAPAKKYWVTGNYIFDYKDRKFQIGSMLQVLLIGDRHKDLPLILFLKFDTEAMGRFTGQIGVYIKARGLSDLVVERMSNVNTEKLKTDDLLNILKLMKMQPIQATPLHLEFIVQYEGKTILSYYLNQTTFNSLTAGDIIDRLNDVLRSDSHINMQLVRRPYYIKHAFSTLIGTPAQILIENTMIASIRGLTTQSLSLNKITRKNQIDLRYTSYAVAKIRSYNPIEDMEFSTIREQGFLSYLPLNNEITLNLAERTVSLAFYRKEPITSGMALKSRTRNCHGNSDASKNKNGVPTSQFNIDDIGINILIEHNEESSKENLIFLLESDVHTSAKVFTKTPYSIVQNLLTLVSMIQLTTIHIGRDKHLTMRLTNEPKSKLEAIFKWEKEDFIHKATAKEESVIKLDCNLFHILNYDDEHPKQLHKWDFSTKYSTFKNSKASKAKVSLNRKTSEGDKWKLCITSTFESMINFKKPLNFVSTIVFGQHEDTSNSCPSDKSKIDLSLSIGSSANVNEIYEKITVDDEQKCTKEIVNFSPVPQFAQCNSSQFSDLLSITDFDFKMDFERMPNIFYDIVTRLNHVLHATMPTIVNDNLNLTKHVELNVKLPKNDFDGTLIRINQNSATIPINYQVTHGVCDRTLMEHSFLSICSLYRHEINTLYEEYSTVGAESKEILLLAECSEAPQIAIFVEYKNQSSEFAQVKIYTGGNYIIIRGDSEPIVYQHEGQDHDLRVSAFEYPPFESDMRVTLMDESVIQIDNNLINAKIQYNMGSLISISLPSVLRTKMCGVCSSNNQSMKC